MESSKLLRIFFISVSESAFLRGVCRGGMLAYALPRTKWFGMRASTLSGDDETVVMGLAFMKSSTSQRMVLNMSSVRIWLPMMA